MDYVTLQDYVIADAADESDRALVKETLNARYGQLWDLEQWTFTQATANVTVTAGSQTVSSLPADLGAVLGLQRADGTPLEAIVEYRLFADRYVGTLNTSSGLPEAFCFWGGTLSVGPTSSESSSSYLLTYEQTFTPLDADGDEPGIPAEYHLTLVHGAKAELFTLKNVLLADGPEAKWQEGLAAMRRKYLVETRGASVQVPAFRPGRIPYRW